MALLVAVGVLLSSASALVFPTIPISRSVKPRNIPGSSPRSSLRDHIPLYMTPKQLKYKARPEVPMIMKKVKSKKSYNVPGYVKGNYEQIKAVFRAHSVEGKMTYEAFLESKYLRFWPGMT
jgi:hypothetical protein